MEEIIKDYHSALLRLSDRFYNKAIKIPGEKFDWNDNAYLWYTKFVREVTKALNKINNDLNSIKIEALKLQLQRIADEEFEKLKLRIEGVNFKVNK